MGMLKQTGKAAIALELAKWCTQYGLPQVVGCIQDTLSKKFGRQLYVVIASGTPYIFHGSGTKEHFSKMWKESKAEIKKEYHGAAVLEAILERMKDKGFQQAEYVWLTKS
jgi:ssDNA-specific exonuclease RecJ